jgi:glycosyltransferase involved in cell wall biosynthesis
MRYSIVTETYPPEINGVALTVQAKEHGLRLRGHDVELVRPRQFRGQRGESHELLVPGLPIPGYPAMRFGLPALRTLRRRWKARRPDAVYIATEGPLGWSALRIARKLGIVVASGFHTRFDEYTRDYGVGFLQPLALGWMRRFHNRSDATLVPTCELADFLRAERFSDVVHLPRAVDTRRFDPARRSPALRAGWGLGENDLAVVYLGRIAAEKNLPLAIRAFREIEERRPGAKFVWVGEGPELAGIRAANPDFVYCGLRRDEDLAAHFASTDLFLFPSHSETFGNVTLEAMASGVATVAFRYGAAKEHMVDGEHGATIGGRDDDGFVAAACRIAGDDALRRAMGTAAREAVAKLRPAQVSADFDELLQRIARDLGARHAQPALACAHRPARRRLVPAQQPLVRAPRRVAILRRHQPARRRHVLVRADAGPHRLRRPARVARFRAPRRDRARDPAAVQVAEALDPATAPLRARRPHPRLGRAAGRVQLPLGPHPARGRVHPGRAGV